MTQTHSSALPPVARSIPLYCNNCESERFFKVIAHISNIAAKAKCEVCGRSKTVRGGEMEDSMSEAGADAKAKTKKPRNTDGLKAAAEKRRSQAAEKKAEVSAKKEAEQKAEYNKQYASLRGQIGSGKVQPYGMRSSFSVADAIQHPKYGLGFVTLATADRIEVAFETGVLPLVHNRA